MRGADAAEYGAMVCSLPTGWGGRRMTALQRLLPVAATGRTHATWRQAVIGLSDRRWPECRICEALQS